MNLASTFNINSLRFYISILIFVIINFVFLKIYLKYSTLNKLFDIPNNRSSHKIVTPSGAGIVFSLTSIIFILFVFKKIYFLILIPLMIISAIDDFKPISSLLRFFVQLLTSSVIVLNSNLFKTLISSSSLLENILSFIILIIASSAIINFFNFSDGIDGLVASCSSIYFIIIGLVINPIFLIIGISLLVFLNFNWSPARLFMGDVGSTFIGAIVVIASFSQAEFINSLVLLLMISPLLLDPFFCVLRRLYTKKNIFIAHKTHLYQRLHQRGWKHSKVALLYSFCTLILSISFIFLGISYGLFAFIFTFLVGFYLDLFHAVPFKSFNLPNKR